MQSWREIYNRLLKCFSSDSKIFIVCMCTDFLLLRRVHAATDNKTPVFLFYCFSRSEPSPSSLFFDTCLNGDALTKPATSLVQILETKIIHGKYKYLIYSRALISRHCGMSNFHSLYTAPPGDRLRKTIRYKHSNQKFQLAK